MKSSIFHHNKPSNNFYHFKEKRFFKRGKQSPLGVIWHHSNFSLELAPQEHGDLEFYIYYLFDETKDEHFFAACPMSSESNKLALWDIHLNDYNFKCKYEFRRTLAKLEGECANESNAQLFGVGYYVYIKTTDVSTLYNIVITI